MKDFPVEPGRIGSVPYLNAHPLIAGIEPLVTCAPPSELAARLHRGELDVALVPVYEAFEHPGYLAVDGVGIASDGDVFSVVLAMRGEMDSVSRVRLDPHSRTSSSLTRVLLSRRFGRACEYTADSGSGIPGEQEAVLRIGDPAIHLRMHASPGTRFVDLGGEWKRWTGLPFVFALWLVRPGFGKAAQAAEALRSVATRGREQLSRIIAGQASFPPGVAHRYLHEHIGYCLGSRHAEGLNRFRHELIAAGLCGQGTKTPGLI